MEEITVNVNWLAVIVGAVLAYLLGWLWYSPKLFGEKWASGVGVSCDDSSEFPLAAMTTQAVGTFLLAWVVGVTAAHDMLFFIALITLTIVFLIIAAGHFAQKSSTAINIEVTYILAMVVIMIVVQAVL